jgi:hypothetical protein
MLGVCVGLQKTCPDCYQWTLLKVPIYSNKIRVKYVDGAPQVDQCNRQWVTNLTKVEAVLLLCDGPFGYLFSI